MKIKKSNKSTPVLVKNLQARMAKWQKVLKSLKFKKRLSESKPLIIVLLLILVLFGVGLVARKYLLVTTINNKPIWRTKVIKELEKQGGKQVVDTLIAKELISQEAQKRSIVVTDAEVEVEIKQIENQVKAQGMTIEEALSSQGLTRADLVEERKTKLIIEKLLKDKLTVTKKELADAIEKNKSLLPEGTSAKTIEEQVKSQLTNQKLSSEVQKLLQELKDKASIKYYLEY